MIVGIGGMSLIEPAKAGFWGSGDMTAWGIHMVIESRKNC